MSPEDLRMHSHRNPIQRLWTFYLLFVIAVLMFCIITPPFKSPDESLHFFKAYQTSLGKVVSVQGPGGLGYPLPEKIAALVNDDFPAPAGSGPVKFNVADIWKLTKRSNDYGNPIFVPFPNAAPYAPTMYLPQGLGIFVGRQLNMAPIGLFYMGRFTNALVGVALLILAITIMPFGKGVMIAIASMPITLWQIGSLSPDATIIGLGFLVIAIAFRLKAETQSRRILIHITNSIAIICLIMAKGVYMPICTVAMFPIRTIFFKRNVHQMLLIGFGTGLFLGWTIFWGGHSGDILASVVSRKTLQHIQTAKPSEQLHLMLAAPLHYLHILATSFVERFPVYLIELIGRGWNTTFLPIPVYFIAACILALGSLVPIGLPVDKSVPTRIWWIVLFLAMVVLIETALYLTGTPLGADYIQGTQGRYFLPFLPLLGFAFSTRLALTETANKRFYAIFSGAIVLLALASLYIEAKSFWS